MTLARPTLGRPAAFTPPPAERLRLPNGLRAALAPVGSIPKVDIRIVLDLGDINEGPGETWLSRLAAEYLKEGAGALNAEALAEAVADLGGDLELDSDDDTTTLRARVLSEHGPAFVRLLATFVREPRFPPESLARLKADLERRLVLSRAQPQMLALERFRAALYGDHPYGRVFPADGTIEGFTTEAARRFWETNTCAAGASLYVTGRFDSAAVSGAITEAFGNWEHGTPPVAPRPTPHSERAVHLVNRPGAEQTTLYLGLPVPDPLHADWVPLSVANALLGGSFSSRLTLNLREDKGYTYSPHSFISLRRRDAHWMQVADVTTPVTGASLHEIFYELDRLRAEPPPADELEGTQRYVAGNYMMRYATPAGVADQLSFFDLHGLPDDYAERYIDRVYAVTADSVRDVVERHLRPESMTIVAVGDAAAMREQLAPYGPIIETS